MTTTTTTTWNKTGGGRRTAARRENSFYFTAWPCAGVSVRGVGSCSHVLLVLLDRNEVASRPVVYCMGRCSVRAPVLVPCTSYLHTTYGVRPGGMRGHVTERPRDAT